MRGAKLRYKTTIADVPYIGATRLTEVKPIDCPDCSDTMLMVYDWDKFSHLCENCGLIVANPSAYLSKRDIDGEE